MKLGVGINIFDGLEFLKPKLINTKQYADFIVAVVQSISYFGEEYKESYNQAQVLKNEGLVDEVILFTPRFDGPIIYSKLKSNDAHKNETTKRNLGRIIAKEKGCTHYCSTDLDEFYFTNQVLEAKEKIIENNYDSTACIIQEYSSKCKFKRKNLEDKFFVPFISNINLAFILDCPYFVYVDPTRRVEGVKNPYLFSPSSLVMHHYSTVRKNKESLVRKFKNSSARDNLKNGYMAKVEEILSFNGGPEHEICEDHFNIGL